MQMEPKSVLAGVFLLYAVQELLAGFSMGSIMTDLGMGQPGYLAVGVVGLIIAWFLTRG